MSNYSGYPDHSPQTMTRGSRLFLPNRRRADANTGPVEGVTVRHRPISGDGARRPLAEGRRSGFGLRLFGGGKRAVGGTGWYSVTNEDGNLTYQYDDEVYSQEDLDSKRIAGTYIGLTYLDSENKIY